MVPVRLSACALRASTVAVFFLPLTYGIKKYGNRERRSVVWDKSLRQAFPPLGKLDFRRRQSAWLRVCVWFACSVSGFEIEIKIWEMLVETGSSQSHAFARGDLSRGWVMGCLLP